MSRKLLPIAGHLPKKRTSAEDNDDEQTNEDSDALFLKEDNAKRARLASLSDTTLQDLPNELLECILVKVVVMEVMDLRLIKSVWKDKADLAISRLKSVSLHWTSILTTNSFRCKLHRTLDGTADVTIRLETLLETPIDQPFGVECVTSLKDEIFTVEQRDGNVHVISVYNRDNLAKVKAVIPLEAEPKCMAACNVSNCVYVGLPNGDNTLSVKRIYKDGDDQFNISPWVMTDPKLSVYRFYVPDNGNLLVRPQQTGNSQSVVRICDANGCLQREVILPRGIPAFRQATDRVTTVLQKSKGNLVMVFSSDYETSLLEIDANGNVVRRCESETSSGFVTFADINGRIVITDENDGSMELFDSEFNLIGSYGFQEDEDKNPAVFNVQFMSERNEIVRTHFYWSAPVADANVASFRFTEE